MRGRGKREEGGERKGRRGWGRKGRAGPARPRWRALAGARVLGALAAAGAAVAGLRGLGGLCPTLRLASPTLGGHSPARAPRRRPCLPAAGLWAVQVHCPALLPQLRALIETCSWRPDSSARRTPAPRNRGSRPSEGRGHCRSPPTPPPARPLRRRRERAPGRLLLGLGWAPGLPTASPLSHRGATDAQPEQDACSEVRSTRLWLDSRAPQKRTAAASQAGLKIRLATLCVSAVPPTRPGCRSG